MAATAADLAASITSKAADAQRVVELTNWDLATATSVDATKLEDACEEAIDRSRVAIGTYDPDNYSLHRRWVRKFVFLVLYEEVGRWEDAESLEGVISRWVNGLEKRKRLAPSSDSPFTPTAPNDNGQTVRPDFDDENLEGYL